LSSHQRVSNRALDVETGGFDHESEAVGNHVVRAVYFKPDSYGCTWKGPTSTVFTGLVAEFVTVTL